MDLFHSGRSVQIFHVTLSLGQIVQEIQFLRLWLLHSYLLCRREQVFCYGGAVFHVCVIHPLAGFGRDEKLLSHNKILGAYLLLIILRKRSGRHQFSVVCRRSQTGRLNAREIFGRFDCLLVPVIWAGNSSACLSLAYGIPGLRHNALFKGKNRLVNELAARFKLSYEKK